MILEFDAVISLALNKLENSSMLPTFDLDNLTRLSLYYIMEIYHLGFHHCTRASWEWVSLSYGEDGKYLTTDEILELDIDMEKYQYHKSNYESGIFPEGFKGSDDFYLDVKEDKEDDLVGQFGWLSPTGDFLPSDWGDHEDSAYHIIQDKGFEEEYDISDYDLCRDFLCYVKGYVLIHNPALDGGYVVTQGKQLTKKQKEFLYDYFMKLGNNLRANHYLAE